MAARSRFVRHAILWALTAPIALLLVAPALTGPEAYAVGRSEIASAERLFGREDHARLAREADRAFRRMFIETGAVAWTMKAFASRSQPTLGVEEAASSFSARWAEAFWLALYRAFYRARLAAEWLWAALALTLAAFADGLATRAIRRAGWGYNNPYAFHVAAHALIGLAGVGAALLLAPVPVHAIAFPLLATGAAAAAWAAAANFQTGA